MEQYFQMFAYYNRWANELVYAAAAELSDEEYRLDLGLFFGSIHRTLNHLLVADRIWMKRFTTEGDHPKQLDTIISDNFIMLRDLRQAEDARICRYADSLDAQQLGGRYTYTPTREMRTISQRLAPRLPICSTIRRTIAGRSTPPSQGWGPKRRRSISCISCERKADAASPDYC